jgi:hypothetical protein
MNASSDTTSAIQAEQMTPIPKKKSLYEMCIEEEEEERERQEKERERQEGERKKMKEISDNRKALLAQGKYELEDGEILE